MTPQPDPSLNRPVHVPGAITITQTSIGNAHLTAAYPELTRDALTQYYPDSDSDEHDDAQHARTRSLPIVSPTGPDSPDEHGHDDSTSLRSPGTGTVEDEEEYAVICGQEPLINAARSDIGTETRTVIVLEYPAGTAATLSTALRHFPLSRHDRAIAVQALWWCHDGVGIPSYVHLARDLGVRPDTVRDWHDPCRSSFPYHDTTPSPVTDDVQETITQHRNTQT